MLTTQAIDKPFPMLQLELYPAYAYSDDAYNRWKKWENQKIVQSKKKKGKLVSMPMKLDDGPIDYDVIHVG